MSLLRTIMAVLFLGAGLCQADIYLVAHRDNPVNGLEHQQAIDLYLARSRAFPSGEIAEVYDRSEPDIRERFVQSLLGMRVRQYDAYWAKLVFAGRVLPLNLAEPEEKLLQELSENRYAIGYIDDPPESAQLKTLLVLSE